MTPRSSVAVRGKEVGVIGVVQSPADLHLLEVTGALGGLRFDLRHDQRWQEEAREDSDYCNHYQELYQCETRGEMEIKPRGLNGAKGFQPLHSLRRFTHNPAGCRGMVLFHACISKNPTKPAVSTMADFGQKASGRTLEESLVGTRIPRLDG